MNSTRFRVGFALIVLLIKNTSMAMAEEKDKERKSDKPSIELLLFLGEFSDKSGQVIDPRTLEVLNEPTKCHPSKPKEKRKIKSNDNKPQINPMAVVTPCAKEKAAATKTATSPMSPKVN